MNWNEQPEGLGDTIAQLAHALGADKVAESWTKATGKDCGCKKRREALNKMFPYENKE